MRILRKCFYEEAVYVYSDEFEANNHFIETLQPKGWEISACWVGVEAGRLKQFYRYNRKLDDQLKKICLAEEKLNGFIISRRDK